MEEVFDGPFVEALRAAQRDSPAGATLYRVPLAGRASKAGERLRVNVATAPLRAPSGQFGMSTVGNIIIIEDVTERVHLEEQLQISDKMASVGLLAAGVAHEVNTPLTGISSFTQMLLSNADPDDPRTRMLEKMWRRGHQDWLSLSHSQPRSYEGHVRPARREIGARRR